MSRSETAKVTLAHEPDLHGLHDVSAQTTLGAYLRAIWARRDFAVLVPLADLRARHMNTVLGNVWHVLNPLLLTAVYYVIFGLILRTDRGVDNFILFLTVGVFFFQYSQRSMMSGARSMTTNRGLIRALQFPRALLVLTATIEQVLAFAPMVVILLVMAIVTGEPVTWRWLLLLPIVAVQTVFNLGGGFLLARAADRFNDLLQVLPYVFRILHYLAGVMFSVDRFVEDPTLRALFDLNPFYAFVSLARGPLLGEALEPRLIVSASVWACTLVVVGFSVFRGGEHTYGRE